MAMRDSYQDDLLPMLVIDEPGARDHLADPDADTWWADCARRGIETLAKTGEAFDAYTLTELGLPDRDHPNRWGAMFNAAYKEGLIEPVGFAYSRRPTRSGGVCRLWRGVSKEVAA